MKSQEMRVKQRKKMIVDWLFFGLMIGIVVILLSIFPTKTEAVLSTAQEYFIEMIIILPAVMILMGLFAVFVPNETVVKHLGKTSGVKGITLAILLGTVPTGPLYVAFPMAETLIRKGARISNIIVFLSSWACIKIPQEMVEFQFLGAEFMVLRLILTIIFVIIMGIVIEKIIELTEGKTEIEGKEE